MRDGGAGGDWGAVPHDYVRDESVPGRTCAACGKGANAMVHRSDRTRRESGMLLKPGRTEGRPWSRV